MQEDRKRDDTENGNIKNIKTSHSKTLHGVVGGKGKTERKRKKQQQKEQEQDKQHEKEEQDSVISIEWCKLK